MIKMLMKEVEDDTTVNYRVGCGCGSSDHDLDIWAEHEDGVSTLMFSAIGSTPYWDVTFDTPWLAWLNEPAKRLKVAIKVLLFGRAEYLFDFILNKDNVAALRYALDEIDRKFDN